MRVLIAPLLALVATTAQALSNSLGNKYGINTDSMISYKSIYFGYAPNYSPSVSFSDLKTTSGQSGATYNVYSQLTSSNVDSGSYDGNDQYPTDDIKSSGAVLIASLMPEIQWTDVSSGLCESVASFFENTFTSQGVTVWLRFAHEMNFYADPNGGGLIYPGQQNYDEFKQAWGNMYNAVSGNDKIYMYWSPNVNSSSEPVDPWWPGASQVDIVGMDYYPEVNGADALPSFDDAYGDFYAAYSEPNNLPFAIGETGTSVSGSESASTDQREAWLTKIINPSSGFANYPNYISCTWFEYGPPTNGITYYLVYDQSSDTVDQTISNTENGSA